MKFTPISQLSPRRFIPWALCGLLGPVACYALPAFPGAEGAGAETIGGRWGRVVYVTNLQDSGPGSLRAALEMGGERTILFKVGGRIHLESPIEVVNPYVTIAGQTAPGDGITISGETIHINTEEVIIRYLRFRRGTLERRDDNLGGYPIRNIIIDHCSFSWGLDENVSFYRYTRENEDGTREKLPTENVTIQWSISSEALDEFNHAFGATWGGKNASFHHNLFASNTARNPSIGWGQNVDIRNNVLFNWRHRSIDGGSGAATVNVVNNYFKPGPATGDGPIQYRVARPQHLDKHYETNEPGGWFVDGNHVVGYPEVTADNWAGGVQLDDDELGGKTLEDVRASQPYDIAPVTTHSAEEAYELVLAHAGATLPRRDVVDRRIAQEVRAGQPTHGNGIIKRIDDVGGWPEFRGGLPPVDTDLDGMPDAWERRYGLDPEDPADGVRDADGDGYTNLEEYLNGTNPLEAVDYSDPANNVSSLPR
ncbi:MAG: polysaccharide lyase [Verrucomicrobiota bacterium JB022]|nr:polysaccharide lyase [Verrucomicrobiota bacterium JB022]